MFKNKKSKKIILSSLVVVMLLSTVVFAANEIIDKKLTATHGRIRVSYQGEDVTKEMEEKYGTPAFTVREYDSRAYVPVRSLAELMGVSVSWNSDTHTADFVDVDKLALEKQVDIKDAEIKRLEAEIDRLEGKVEEKEEEKEEEKDIKKLETQLNKDYRYVDNVDFKIVLKESGSKVIADIFIDTRSSTERNDWLRMHTNDKRGLMEDIANDISKKLDTYNVEGSIYDNYERETLYEFKMSTSGRVSITDRDYTDSGYRKGDLEDDAKYELDYYLRDLGYIDKINIRETRTNEITGEVTFKDDGPSYEPRIRDIEDAVEDAAYKLGSNVYLDIDVYYGKIFLGRFVSR